MSQFSIDGFRANLINGVARNNLFLVQGNFPNAGLGAVNFAAAAAGAFLGAAAAGAINAVAGAIGAGSPNNQVSFLAKAASIPNSVLNIGTANYMGRQFKYPADRTFNDWNITVYNDGAYTLRKAFESWQNTINTNKTNVGPNAMNSFMTDWYVSPLTREGNVITTYKFVGCWPSTLGEIALDMGQQSEPSNFQVTMTYQYYEITNVTS
jgi:hypothetical protein